MKRRIFFLLTIMISAGISSALDLSSGNCHTGVQCADVQYFDMDQPNAIDFGGLNIQLPDTWQISNNSGKLVALSPDNTACVLMKPIDLKTLDPDFPDFPKLGEKFVQEFKTTHKLTLLKTIKLPITFWASTDVPFDWKKLAASRDVPFDWKNVAFVVGKSTVTQSEQSQLKLIKAEGIGKLGATGRWAGISLIGLPNGRVLLLFSVSGMDQKYLETNKQLIGKILSSIHPE